MKRLILEIGSGKDLYGGDYTKAAKRAVKDALDHSSITMFRSLNLDPAKMVVKVTIGVQKPDQVDCVAVAETLPRGKTEVRAVFGGQDVVDAENKQTHLIATAAIEAFYDI